MTDVLPSLTAGMVPEAAEPGAELPCAGYDCVSRSSSAARIYGVIGISGFWQWLSSQSFAEAGWERCRGG